MENVIKYLIKKQIWEGNLPKEQKLWYSTRELQHLIFDYPEMIDALMIDDELEVSYLAGIVVDAVNEKIEERDGGTLDK